MAKKIEPIYSIREVVYSQERWKLLDDLRSKAIEIMTLLEKVGIESIVHGSIARGDVNKKSDIDIFIPEIIPSYIIERAILDGNYQIIKREITQATPNHAVKAIIYIDERTRITFPLIPLRQRELEFYKFGGKIGLEELKLKKRVPGIDKRLMLIIPTDYGHYEYSVIYNALEAAKILGISIETIMERIRVLKRRDEIGRSGIYFKKELNDNETFEGVLKERIERDPSLKRLISKRGNILV
ncbi:MAG: nucleotidyltransferase domain-containing protein [Candidatus Methanomethylicia archaeon]|nr:nucleotidyltransferase domain-containing protein [Candidatus Methanomethylicia archaeon]